MDPSIDFVTYMWVIGILFVLVAVFGGLIVGASFRENKRRREEQMAQPPEHYPWDDSPDGLGHR